MPQRHANKKGFCRSELSVWALSEGVCVEEPQRDSQIRRRAPNPSHLWRSHWWIFSGEAMVEDAAMWCYLIFSLPFLCKPRTLKRDSSTTKCFRIAVESTSYFSLITSYTRKAKKISKEWMLLLWNSYIHISYTWSCQMQQKFERFIQSLPCCIFPNRYSVRAHNFPIHTSLKV